MLAGPDGDLAHGYRLDEQAGGHDGFWTQFNRRDLRDRPEPALPAGFSFLTAEQVPPPASAQAHRDAWHPSTFTDHGMRSVRETWPYQPGLHVLVQAPDGTLAATAIIWLDERNGTAEFEPVGTHQGYRRLGLARSLLRYGMLRAAQAGATEALVACLGAPAHTAARALTRIPVAWYTAPAIAAAVPTIPTSPMPLAPAGPSSGSSSSIHTASMSCTSACAAMWYPARS